jgi:hypothetical protein
MQAKLQEQLSLADAEIILRRLPERIQAASIARAAKIEYPISFAAAMPRGVIYLRFRPHTPEERASILLNLLQTQGLQFEERFTVVEGDRIRQRPLP